MLELSLQRVEIHKTEWNQNRKVWADANHNNTHTPDRELAGWYKYFQVDNDHNHAEDKVSIKIQASNVNSLFSGRLRHGPEC